MIKACRKACPVKIQNMKKEKVVLSFIGIAIGLLFAGVAFYFYQSTKVINTNKDVKKAVISPAKAPKESLYLVISEPTDEQVVNKKVVTLAGQTIPGATVLIITKAGAEVVKPTTMGAFSTTLTLEDGENLIRLVAYGQNGETTMVSRVITFSTEDF